MTDGSSTLIDLVLTWSILLSPIGVGIHVHITDAFLVYIQT